MALCDNYFQHGLEYRCYSLEHTAECSCGGDVSKCDFFPEKRKPDNEICPMSNTKPDFSDAYHVDRNWLVSAKDVAFYAAQHFSFDIYMAVTTAVRGVPRVDAVPVKCKIGELVYALWEAPVKQKYIIYCAEVKEIRIGMRNCRLTTTYRLEPIMYRGHIHEYRDEDFGKLVFPSENEAEAALAKMDGGDGDG